MQLAIFPMLVGPAPTCLACLPPRVSELPVPETIAIQGLYRLGPVRLVRRGRYELSHGAWIKSPGRKTIRMFLLLKF